MENISAISTPRGKGGVAIIRVSGDAPLDLAARMFVPSAKVEPADFKPNVMYPGRILCDGVEDYGMCVYFRGPRSFTGEDTVEFHCHGGELVAEAVLKKTFTLGARPAEAGEFSRRAFLNGKLTLSSAEGMADMINATSEASLKAAGALYRKETVKAVTDAQKELKDILATLAADMDYPEEDVAESEAVPLKERLGKILASIDELASTYPRGKVLKSGVRVALCGKPNVGKSSLLNALIGYDKAIVSSEAGTTRDAVEGEIEMDGILFRLTDTAGLRESAGPVETLGIEMARDVIASADVVVRVYDGIDDEDEEDFPNGGKLIKVFNKADILTPPGGFDCVISAKTGEGIDKLKKLILSVVPAVKGDDEAVICEERHVNAIKRAAESLKRAILGLDEFTPDMAALDVTAAWSALGEITGESASESIIDEVFDKFCVGK
ncbi:MAG: tRNA uridine-5-carboxymethylaminomethyl(34) synthesis GTPase MnmE [Clostridia bacterium]|nr:tRNA uridine-5-carboxymethylaminomethyl(34) synthesis GTPase MnmE [Clostridia bacterium]